MTDKILIDQKLLFKTEQLLDELRGNINPEQAYAEEFEAEILITRDRLREALDAPSVPEGWHTIDEQPEDGERVLCFEDYSKFGKPYKGIDCYYYRKGIGFVALPDDTDSYGGITHWTRPTLPNSASPKAPTTDDRKDAEIAKLVRMKLTSGNGIPVERCTIRASEIAAIDTAIAAQKGEKE